MKTFAGAAMLMVLPCLAPAQSGDPLLQRFAECAGRMSAQMEYAWLVGIPPEDITAQRAAMIGLLDAVTPPEARRDALALRIEAKAAHWRLLTRATFNDDPADADWALTRAQQAVAGCTALALS